MESGYSKRHEATREDVKLEETEKIAKGEGLILPNLGYL